MSSEQRRLPVTPVVVVAYSDAWPMQFQNVEMALRTALASVPIVGIEHVGSTSVPGLPAKPILDIDVIVRRSDVSAAKDALARIGYTDLGELGIPDRHLLQAPDENPERHVFICVEGTVSVRNHLAVREVLRHDDELRDAYAEVKISLAGQPNINIESYVAQKSEILQRILERSDLTQAEIQAIRDLNDPGNSD